MIGSSRLLSPLSFSETLFERMLQINPGIQKVAFYEFRYAVENLYPVEGWDSVVAEEMGSLENRIRQRGFFEAIETKPRENERIVLDKSIAHLTRMLFVGLVNGKYTPAWVDKIFYFDLRGFFFLPRTIYFTDAAVSHLGGKPYRTFDPRQKEFDQLQDVGYLDFQAANLEIDQAFTEMIQSLIRVQGTPILITIAGPTASGKTEITERLIGSFDQIGKQSTSIEMDNFLLDRDFRESRPMGKDTTHFELFRKSLEQILMGNKITISRYNSITATSSHDLKGNLKPGCQPLEVEPADIIFLEGNFPFQIEEISSLIGIKVVYLTDDPIRLKRKWKRDVDYRKSYDANHFRNRYFKTQFLRADDCYRAQIEKCDIVVATTPAAIWVTPSIAKQLKAA